MQYSAFVRALGAATVALGVVSLALAQAPPGPDHMVVAGFDRFYGEAKADAVHGGELLLGELNCLSCHKAEGLPEGYVRTKKAPLLTAVGERARMAYFTKFLADPHKTKAGATMPNVLAALPAADQPEAVDALVSFLASTGKSTDAAVRAAAVHQGEQLYHTLGCVACHGPRKDESPAIPGMVNLGKPSRKYTLEGLTKFLLDPLAIRPSARMPHFGLSQDDARDLASFLLKDLSAPAALEVSVYEGSFSKLPDFSKLKPVEHTASEHFDRKVTKRTDNFAIRFVGKILIDKEGSYTFTVTSDDGSRLLIDGKQVVDNDGVHPPRPDSGKAQLSAGTHDLVLEYFESQGGEELSAQYDSGAGKQPLEKLLWAPPPAAAAAEPPFVANPALVEKGRKYFATLGCAACHELKEKGAAVASILVAPTLAKMKSSGGCLSETATKNTPFYTLNALQRTDLTAAIEALRTAPAALTEKEQVARAFVTFNCYACHERSEIGGPQQSVEASFTTTEPEMGDEGRLPPSLTGVGGKLRPEYLQRIFDRGAKDRPYMLARMPKFGSENVGFLVGALGKLDALEPMPKPPGELLERQTKQTGRQLAGDKGYSCMKCHTWGKLPAEGVQAISLTLMHDRLREEWFRRYVVDPPKFRPGTRMPTAWPGGQATLKKILDGNTEEQVYALWLFLEDGERAALPSGYVVASMELAPLSGEAIIYRNFIEGAGTRAIAVGYPEKLNLAWDANDMQLALLWKNGFIDAKKHWVDRGSGFQQPLGDSVLKFAVGPPLAVLDSEKEKWPAKSPRASGFQFRGYTLDAARRPKFNYTFNEVHVEDYPVAVDDAKAGPFLHRTLTFTAPAPLAKLYFRALTGKKISEPVNGVYALDDGLHLRVQAAGKPEVSNDQLLVPVVFENGKATITLDYVW